MGWLTLLRLSVTDCGSGPALSRLSRNSLGIPSSLRTPRSSYIPTTWACARARAARRMGVAARSGRSSHGDPKYRIYIEGIWVFNEFLARRVELSCLDTALALGIQRIISCRHGARSRSQLSFGRCSLSQSPSRSSPRRRAPLARIQPLRPKRRLLISTSQVYRQEKPPARHPQLQTSMGVDYFFGTAIIRIIRTIRTIRTTRHRRRRRLHPLTGISAQTRAATPSTASATMVAPAPSSVIATSAPTASTADLV